MTKGNKRNEMRSGIGEVTSYNERQSGLQNESPGAAEALRLSRIQRAIDNAGHDLRLRLALSALLPKNINGSY